MEKQLRIFCSTLPFVFLIGGAGPAAADKLCTRTPGGCSDNGCKATGGTCCVDCDGIDCSCIKNASGGKGKADPLGPPGSPFSFSSGDFLPGTFTYATTLSVNGTDYSPLLTSFSSTVRFAPSADPSVYEAVFESYEFDFMPFTVAGTAWGALQKQVLIDAPEFNVGTLNLTTGRMSIQLPVAWLDTTGARAFTDVVQYQIKITETADPSIVDVDFTSGGGFGPSLSEFLCLRHNVSPERKSYAKEETETAPAARCSVAGGRAGV
ncbi:MAG: hypothetical protein PHW25_15550, partial [Zoogloea sp.]|uniref:hypothetical protein n=1 Tax=Zoogloea sp. TaxID=49181 RepID=UPI00262C97BE